MATTLAGVTVDVIQTYIPYLRSLGSPLLSLKSRGSSRLSSLLNRSLLSNPRWSSRSRSKRPRGSRKSRGSRRSSRSSRSRSRRSRSLKSLGSLSRGSLESRSLRSRSLGSLSRSRSRGSLRSLGSLSLSLASLSRSIWIRPLPIRRSTRSLRSLLKTQTQNSFNNNAALQM